MKQYTKEDLIGNILVAGTKETYNIYASPDNSKDGVFIKRIEKNGIGSNENYSVHIILDALNSGDWSLIPSKELQAYEIY